MRWLDGITMDDGLHGHEFEQTPGDGEGQGSLVYCSPWGRKELDMTEQLNNSLKRKWNTRTLLVDTRMVLPLWKTVWQLLKKLNMESEINKVPGAHNPSSVWSGCLLDG